MLLKFFLNVLFIYISTVSAQVELLMKGYKYVQNVNTFYKEHRVKLNWHDAKETCVSENTELALPSTPEEAEVMRSLLSSDTDEIWLWLTDIYASGEFYISNGSAPDSLYTNWKDGEPNPYDNSCAMMQRDGFYRDVDCKKKANFICFKRSIGEIINPQCQTSDQEYIYNPGTKHCYKLHLQPQNWTDAFKTCKDELATLAIINSEDESHYFVDVFKALEKAGTIVRTPTFIVLVDFSDLVVEGLPETHRGQNLEDAGWNEWGPLQPDNIGKDHCGSIFWNGRLNDVGCDVKAMFFCEKENVTSY